MSKQHDNSFKFTVQKYEFTSDTSTNVYTARYQQNGTYAVNIQSGGISVVQEYCREVVIENILSGAWNVLQEEANEEAILTSEKESKIVKAATKLFKIVRKYDSGAEDLTYEEMKELKRVRNLITRVLCDGGR